MIIDICIVLLLLIAVFIGYKKGFIKLVTKLLGFFVAIVLAYLLCGKLGGYIYNNLGVGDNIKQAVTKTVTSYINKNETNKKTDNDKQPLTSDISEFSNDKQKESNNFINKYIDDLINKEKINENINNTKDNLISSVSEKIAMFVTKGLAFVGIFIVTMIIVYLLAFILDSVFSLPVLNTFNKTGGVIVSVILLLIRVSILFAIIAFISPLNIGFIDKIIVYINESLIGKILYNNNLLTYIISKLI